jgi:protein involved in polysaccharide export with SLBB domain
MVGVASHTAKTGGLCFVVGLVLTFAGCGGGSPDSAQLGRFRPTPAVNVILDSLGVAEEPAVAWENGEDPKPKDVLTAKSDSTLRSGDVVRISIFELLQEGAMATNDYVVSETGKISLPEVGVVQVGGLTEVQLEQEIKRVLAPAILRNPSVSVALVQSQRMFLVLGAGVTQPGRYAIPQRDFRLSDALAAAGGLGQFNVSNVYVSRSEEGAQQATSTVPAREMELLEPQSNAPERKSDTGPAIPPPAPAVRPGGVPRPSEPAEKFETQQEMLDLIMPSAKDKSKMQDSGPGAANSRTGETAAPSYSAVPRFPDTPLVTRQPSSGQADISASELPGGFRLFMPPGHSGQSGPSREEIVQAFSEFAGSVAASAAKPSSDSANAGGVEWVFQNGKWVSIPVQGQGQRTEDKGRTSQISDFGFRIPDSNVSTNPQSAIRNPQSSPGAAQKQTEEQGEWVFKDGRWVQIRAGLSEPAKPPLAAPPAGSTLPIEKERPPVESEPDQAAQNRLIKIPADRLLAGDPRYNVVIKPGDIIHVPADVVGEFCITGNVVHGGYINMTGRPMTLKQAIAAAGGLSPMAWPQYCEVVRRIGPKKEEIVMVDLGKIARGEQPDFLIKPNDLINVGTHPLSQWRAAMRNAQKPAYGSVFVYDRNFSDADYGLRQRSRP